MRDEKHTTFKKQFAYELYVRTEPFGLEHEETFVIAQEIARRIYPFDPTSSSALRIATEWVKDPIVINAFLQLKNGEADGFGLPTKAQFIMAICDRLDRISEKISSLESDYKTRKKAIRLRRSFVELSNLVSDCL